MPEAHFSPGESFPVQFAWRLPDGGYVRAIFQADVLDLVPSADKYVVRLSSLVAGREEDPDSQPLAIEDTSRDYWALVGKLIGRRITVAYEADDGRPLYLRLETLTGEHNFFTRYEDAEVIARGLETQLRRAGSGKNPTP
ncbi:MAG: hypothetical protein R3C44_16260 [Chloroflexota bacterium]